jgi:hypothetical protein
MIDQLVVEECKSLSVSLSRFYFMCQKNSDTLIIRSIPLVIDGPLANSYRTSFYS